jgi:peptidoglycan/LPS O-acetylase OafA/YrhL
MITALTLVKIHFLAIHPNMGSGLELLKTPASYVLSSLLFIPYRNSIGEISPLLGQGWTLNYEMFFYLLFSLALLLRVNVIKFITPVLCGIALCSLFRRDSWPAVTSLISPFVLEFLFGLILGCAVRKGLRINFHASVYLGLAGLAWLFFFPLYPDARPILWGMAALLIVNAAAKWESVPKALLQIGDSSYSLYLSHMFVIPVAFHILPRFAEWSSVGICLSLSIGASLIIYRCIEKPIGDRLNRLSGYRRLPWRDLEPASPIENPSGDPPQPSIPLPSVLRSPS